MYVCMYRRKNFVLNITLTQQFKRTMPAFEKASEMEGKMQFEYLIYCLIDAVPD